MKYVHVIETGDGDWYLSIGKRAPHQNRAIRVPRRVAVMVMRRKNKEQE
jgi:hypothetical protein